MNYRGYNPERDEVIPKFLRSARSEMLHIMERMDDAEMSKEDMDKCTNMVIEITTLINKLEKRNE